MEETPNSLIQQDYAHFFNQWEEKKKQLVVNEINEVELYILKCHILLEHELNNYLENRLLASSAMGKSGFSFSAKLKLAKMLDCFEHDDDGLEAFLNKINTVRNQIAHSFKYDESTVKELLFIQKKLMAKSTKTTPAPSEISKTMFEYAISYYTTQLNIKWKMDLKKHAVKIIEVTMEVFRKQKELVNTDSKYAEFKEAFNKLNVR